MQIECVDVGACAGKDFKDVAVTFPEPFGDVPPGIPDTIIVSATVVLDAAHYPLGDYTDTYSVNVAGVTKEGFTARIRRCAVEKGTGWDMNLKLNYIAEQCTDKG